LSPTGPRKRVNLSRSVLGEKIPEGLVSASVKALITAAGGEWWSTEAGALGHWDQTANGGKGKFIARKGGTRTSSGFPDISAMMRLAVPGAGVPLEHDLTTETKGSDTETREGQWRYTLFAMHFGRPHLIVRSQEAWLTGLRFLGLLPPLWQERPPYPFNWSIWPDNLNYLPRTRERFWRQIDPDFRPLELWGEIPDNKLPRPPHPELLDLRGKP
jgi:hypothetical protein